MAVGASCRTDRCSRRANISAPLSFTFGRPCTSAGDRFAAAKGLKLTLTVDVNPEDGVPKAKIEAMKVALRELGMSEDIDVGEGQ
jgi:hypothetical protein